MTINNDRPVTNVLAVRIGRRGRIEVYLSSSDPLLSGARQPMESSDEHVDRLLLAQRLTRRGVTHRLTPDVDLVIADGVGRGTWVRFRKVKRRPVTDTAAAAIAKLGQLQVRDVEWLTGIQIPDRVGWLAARRRVS
jgi:hypothetical protein